MDWNRFAMEQLKRLPRWMRDWIERRMKTLPPIRSRLQQENKAALVGMERELKPYREQFVSFSQLPENGMEREAVLTEMERMKRYEDDRWVDGYASGAVYHGDRAHVDFLNLVYALHSQSNPLHADLFPSIVKFEAGNRIDDSPNAGRRSAEGLWSGSGNLRNGFLRWYRKHPAGDEGLSRLGT